jgi:Flp pilus assembly protein protease CpaA
MFDLLIIRIIILLLAIAFAAYTDYKSGYIYNWLNYSLAIIGLIFNIFTYSFISNLNIIFGCVAIFVVGYIIYYFGKIGGGDIKLFIAINLMLPYYYNQPFVLFVLLFSCLFSVVIVSLIYTFKLFSKIRFTTKFLKQKISSIIKSILIFVFFCLFMHYSIKLGSLPIYFYYSLIPIFLGLFIMIFQDEIKKYIYLQKLPLEKIEDGDVIATEHISKTLLEKLKLGKRQVIEEEDLKRFKKLKIKSLPIYYNLPKFGPYILLGTIFTLIFLTLI